MRFTEKVKKIMLKIDTWIREHFFYVFRGLTALIILLSGILALLIGIWTICFIIISSLLGAIILYRNKKRIKEKASS